MSENSIVLKAACIQAAATIYAESTARSGRGSDQDQAVTQTMQLARKLLAAAIEEGAWTEQ
jgi:hypothetical protein